MGPGLGWRTVRNDHLFVFTDAPGLTAPSRRGFTVGGYDYLSKPLPALLITPSLHHPVTPFPSPITHCPMPHRPITPVAALGCRP